MMWLIFSGADLKFIMRFFQFLHYVNLISLNIPEEGLSTPIPPPPTTLSWSLLERLSFQYVLIWIKEIFESGFNNKISAINIFSFICRRYASKLIIENYTFIFIRSTCVCILSSKWKIQENRNLIDMNCRKEYWV